MFEFGVRVCGGRSSPGGTVRADVTPPCLEGGGEDRPGYVRGGGGGADTAESEGAALAPVQLRESWSGAACWWWLWPVQQHRWTPASGTGWAGTWRRWRPRCWETHEGTGGTLRFLFPFPPACELIVQTSSPATNWGDISSMPPSAGTVIT